MPQNKLSLFSPAKVNLFLEVVDKRPDGFHNLESVFQALDFGDRLEAERSDGDAVTLVAENPGLPVGEQNLAVRAAGLLKKRTGARGGLHFTLGKNVPMESGLGGGSSNAAAALLLADKLLGTGLTTGELAELGAELGSDVPFFLYGGACLARGRGEMLEPVAPLAAGTRITLALSNLRSGTAAAYGGLTLPGPGEARTTGPMLAALRDGGPEALAEAAFNRFEQTVYASIPELGALHRALSAIPGVSPRMSGSGSALWFPGPASPVEETMRANPGLAGLARKIGLRLVETTPCPERPEPIKGNL